MGSTDAAGGLPAWYARFLAEVRPHRDDPHGSPLPDFCDWLRDRESVGQIPEDAWLAFLRGQGLDDEAARMFFESAVAQ